MLISNARPRVAGTTKLFFEKSAPTRNGDTIILSDNPQHEFYPLKDGSQFIFHLANFAEPNRRVERPRFHEVLDLMFPRHAATFFGGTDEGPFLTSLREPAYEAFMQGGESGFFQSLVPQRIIDLEERWNKKAVRQGDIFALPLPCPFSAIKGPILGFPDYPLQLFHDAPEVTDQSLFGTRHSLIKGRIWRIMACGNRIEVGQGSRSHITTREFLNNSVIICEGQIQAPDHNDLVLDRPHVIAQTANLFTPADAD